ncbi:MAG TPA: GTPase HflX, partial [Polyangiaceae bacterium]
LDEALEATLLLYVVDASDPTHEAELKVTRDVLGEIGAGSVPSLLLLNKRDRLTDEDRAELAKKHPDAIQLSAHDPADVAMLRQRILDFFDAAMTEDVLVVPYNRQSLLGSVHENARVLEETYDEVGTHLKVRAMPAEIARLRKQLEA